MRRPDGKMSKKDRRALLAFGITPSEDKVNMADLLRRITPDPGPTFVWTTQNSNSNAGNAWLDLRTQTVTWGVGSSVQIRLSVDPTPPPGT